MSSRSHQEQAVDPLVARFLGSFVLLVVFTLLGMELYLGHLQVGGHVVAMILIAVSGWAMFAPVLRQLIRGEGGTK